MMVLARQMLAVLLVLVAVAAQDSARANHFILCEDAKCLNDATTTGDFDPSTVTQSYVVVALYSDQNGSTQYIRLKRNPDTGVPPPLVGSVLTVRHRDFAKRFVIRFDAPPGLPPGGELVFSTSADLSDDDAQGPKPPDYVLPERFLPTDGGSIDLDGLNAWNFGPLPIDGSTALLRSGETARPCFSSYVSGTFCVAGGFSSAVEYVNEGLNRYFLTASEPDIDAMESGQLMGWRRTGVALPVLTSSKPECCTTPTPPVPVCRYYFPPPLGDAHFLSAFEDECDAVGQRFPGAVLETRAAFFVVLPNEDGVCPGFWKPVFRLWDGLTAQHRYLDFQSRTALEELVGRGWIPEGRGRDGVAWCE